jgi:hypothetical protein
VAYDTSFEKLEDLRAKMLAFVESRRRDFQPIFDVTVGGKQSFYNLFT